MDTDNGIIEITDLSIPDDYDYSHQPEEAWEHCCGICDSGGSDDDEGN